jgi:hypothetical protein
MTKHGSTRVAAGEEIMKTPRFGVDRWRRAASPSARLVVFPTCQAGRQVVEVACLDCGGSLVVGLPPARVRRLVAALGRVHTCPHVEAGDGAA